jgi:DNA-directed RNA polymerase subunit RPC12/RpoP
MRSFQCPVCGEKRLQFSQLLIALVPFMPRTRCCACGSRVVLAREVRDNAIGALILGFMMVVGMYSKTKSPLVYLIFLLVVFGVFAWLIQKAKFVPAMRPDYLSIFFAIAIFILLIFVSVLLAVSR